MLATPPAETAETPVSAPALQRARGVGRIAVKMRGGRSVVDTLFQEGCAKIRMPNTHDASLQAVLINTAGGLCGGDDVRWVVSAGSGTAVALTTQACERVYRSLGPEANVQTRLVVSAGASLAWLPQETILFEGARLKRSLDVELDEGSSFCALEAVILGRSARGETAQTATLSDRWRVRRNGKLLHAEQTRLGGTSLERDSTGLLARANALATLLYVGADAERRADMVRPYLGASAGLSVTGERVVVRALADSGLALRRILVPALRAMLGIDALPRLWHL